MEIEIPRVSRRSLVGGVVATAVGLGVSAFPGAASAAPGKAGLPARVVGGYWTYWGNPIRVKDIPAGYNTVFLFHATPSGGAPGSTGALEWRTPSNGRGAGTNLKADISKLRESRFVILTAGGSREHVDLSTRARSQAFLDSVRRIYDRLGGFDGLDWNTYEGRQIPNTSEMIWVSQQLRTIYGSKFAITTPPAPWREIDLTHCRRMVQEGVLDLVSPQFYDSPYAADARSIVEAVERWANGIGDITKLGLGFGLNPGAYNYSTISTITQAWAASLQGFAGLRGAYNWDIATDERLGWAFARTCAPVIMAPRVADVSVEVPGPRVVHVVAAGDTYGSIARQYGIVDWQTIFELNRIEPEALHVGMRILIP